MVNKDVLILGHVMKWSCQCFQNGQCVLSVCWEATSRSSRVMCRCICARAARTEQQHCDEDNDDGYVGLVCEIISTVESSREGGDSGDVKASYVRMTLSITAASDVESDLV